MGAGSSVERVHSVSPDSKPSDDVFQDLIAQNFSFAAASAKIKPTLGTMSIF